MAGREVAGYENSLATLFVGASMVITPSDGTPPEVIQTLKDYFRSVGFAMTVVTTPETHDDMIAFTSQLCHIIATTYARDPRVKDAIGFSAGSYANMTRIATQNASDWSALYSENRDALVGIPGWNSFDPLKVPARRNRRDDLVNCRRQIGRGNRRETAGTAGTGQRGG